MAGIMGISQHPIYSVCSRTKYLFSFGSHCPCPLCCSVSIHREHPPCCCSHSLLIRSRLLWLQFQAPQHSPYSQTPTGKQGFYVWVAKPWVNSSWSVLSVILKCGPSISIAWELVEKANPQLHSNLQNLKFWGGVQQSEFHQAFQVIQIHAEVWEPLDSVIKQSFSVDLFYYTRPSISFFLFRQYLIPFLAA